MNLIVTALKQKLAPFGWIESVRRGGDQKGYAVSAVRPQPQLRLCIPARQLLYSLIFRGYLLIDWVHELITCAGPAYLPYVPHTASNCRLRCKTSTATCRRWE
jgi:hypothetical protein